MPIVSPVVFNQSRRLRTSLGVVLAGAFAAYYLAQYVIADDMVGLSYVALCIVGIAAFIMILNNWRKGFYVFLAWLLFEDFARKFLGNNMLLFFAKDFL